MESFVIYTGNNYFQIGIGLLNKDLNPYGRLSSSPAHDRDQSRMLFIYLILGLHRKRVLVLSKPLCEFENVSFVYSLLFSAYLRSRSKKKGHFDLLREKLFYFHYLASLGKWRFLNFLHIENESFLQSWIDDSRKTDCLLLDYAEMTTKKRDCLPSE